MRVDDDQLKAITIGDLPPQYREIVRQHSPPRVRIWRGRSSWSSRRVRAYADRRDAVASPSSGLAASSRVRGGWYRLTRRGGASSTRGMAPPSGDARAARRWSGAPRRDRTCPRRV